MSLFARKQEIARGTIAHQPNKHPIFVNEETGETTMLNVATTRTRALVVITEVLAPQVQLAWYKQTLQQLQDGKATFEAVVSLSCLRTHGSNPASSISDPLPPAQIDSSDTVIHPPLSHIVLTEDNDTDTEDETEDVFEDSEDAENFAYTQPSESTNLPSRILVDVFHEMYRVSCTLSTKHSLHHHFLVAFSDTILVPDKGDKENIQAYLVKKEKNWDMVRKSDPDWLWKRVRRYIPEKTLLHHILEEFFNAWGPVVCLKDDKPFFSDDSWKKAKGVLYDVKKGWANPLTITMCPFVQEIGAGSRRAVPRKRPGYGT